MQTDVKTYVAEYLREAIGQVLDSEKITRAKNYDHFLNEFTPHCMGQGSSLQMRLRTTATSGSGAAATVAGK